MKILIVEDNPLSAKVLESTLQKHGYDILSARDGTQAIEQLNLHPEVDIVITDMAMPNTNGVELLKRLKQRVEWSDMPVIVCTSMNSEVVTMIEEAAQGTAPVMGFRYLLKPIEVGSLLQTVKQAAVKRRPVMQNGDQIMSRLGVDDQGFADLVVEYLKLVEETMAILELDDAKGISINFNDLLEGAKLLGAERLINAIDGQIKDGMIAEAESTSAKFPLLLHEFKALRNYLKTYAVKSPWRSPSVPKERILTDNAASYR